MFQKSWIQSRIKLALIGAVFLLAPLVVQALGLGDARVLSKLNEPLNIELEILTNNPTELQNILPNLADLQAFERAGLEKPDYLTTIQFKVESHAQKPLIRLTTIDSVKEPVVNLLIELTGAQGRIVKEYTLLLDPPEFNHPPAPQSTVRVEPNQVSTLQNNHNLFDAFEENIPTVAQKAPSLSNQEGALQSRISKVEAQLTELVNQKQTLEKSKLLLSEENNNLHDLVQLKQKEIEMLHMQDRPIENQTKQSSLAHLAKAQMIELDETKLSEESSFFSSPWLRLGLILAMTFSALLALREWFKRKELAFPFSFNLPKFSFGHKSGSEEAWPADFQKNKPQNFQEVVSILQNSGGGQGVSTPSPSGYTQSKGVDLLQEKALNTAPLDEPVIVPLLEDADVYITFGKVKMAEEIILKVLDNQPDNIKARLKLIDLFSSQERLPEAEAQFDLLPVSFKKDNPEQYAKYLKQFKNKLEEEAFVEEISSELKNNPILEPTVELINSFSNTSPSSQEGANPNFETAPLEQDASVYQTKLDFAKVYIDMHDLHSARDLLKEVIQLGPNNLKLEAQALLDSLH